MVIVMFKADILDGAITMGRTMTTMGLAVLLRHNSKEYTGEWPIAVLIRKISIQRCQAYEINIELSIMIQRL